MRAIGFGLICSLAAAAGLSAGLASAAQAQDAPAAGTPPNWDTLVRCAQMANQDDRLACYDDAMRAAGYAPNPAAVQAEHHRTFGLPIPHIRGPKRHHAPKSEQAARHAPVENANQIVVTIDQVAVTQPTGKVVVFTTDGQIWSQYDTTVVNSYPREGATMVIHRNALGGYVCDVNKYQAVLCKRVK